MASIEKHPWFGGGFGTEAAKYDARVDDVANFSSNSTTTRERGSSYLRIMESVGLVGVVPFFCLVVLTVVNLGRVVKWLGHTRNPFSPAVPIAAVLTAGLIHAMFEDWLFAVGYYICIFFWSLAFMLPDFIPARVATPADQPFLPIQISPTEAAFAPTSQ
jgi:O-antigen ligase